MKRTWRRFAPALAALVLALALCPTALAAESEKVEAVTAIPTHSAVYPAEVRESEECLKSETARLMLANSEFLLLFNQAATDRAELAKLLHISDTQMSYITNAEAGHGLLRIGGSLVPFSNTIPKDTELYRLMSTTPGEG